jgi:hypothetical protein
MTQENGKKMLRTWVSAAGDAYVPEDIPACWRRVADQPSWEAAENRFGPLDNVAPPEIWAESWRDLHARLGKVAELWVPASDDAKLFRPVDRTKVRRDEMAQSIHGAVIAMIAQHQLVVGTDFGTWRPEIRAESLRGFLLADCATAIGEATAYRRCDHCHEWFSPSRVDARLCSGACKQAHWVARQAVIAARAARQRPR